jgi:hypothetical protein
MDSTTDYDASASRLITSSRFSRGANEVHATAAHYVYTSAHVGDLLTEAGFTDINRYGGTDDKPYALGDRQLLLTAHRITSYK